MERVERGAGVGTVLIRILGVVIAVIGLTLVIGGIQLATLGGSFYYLLTGALMVVSGALLFMRKTLGAWLYVLIVIGTIGWALWEVGLNGWALVPRVIAPLVLLVPVILSLGGLKRERGGLAVLGGFAALAVFCVIGGVVVGFANLAIIRPKIVQLAHFWRDICP